MKVSEYIAEFLIEKGIKHVFGFQGGAILKVVDSIVESGKIEYIQGFHEQASAFCADAYSRVTGGLGVAVATSGPGATNLINGIANAHFDSIPTIFIAGQDYSENVQKPIGVRQNGFQDLDIVNVVKPITKYATTISNANKIRYELEKAFYLAKNGRGGAVLLDIPIDIQFADVDKNQLKSYTPPHPQYNLSQIDDIISAIKNAKRPLILVGGGIRLSHSINEFKKFLELTSIPAVATLNGLDSSDKVFSFAGLHGNTYSNLAIYNADLIIALGTRFGQRQIGKKLESYCRAKVIRVEIDKTEINRTFINEHISLNTDLKRFFKEINPKLENIRLPEFKIWTKQIEKWKEKYDNNSCLNKDGIDPVKFVREVSKLFKNDTVITSDVGQNQMWVAQAINIKNNQRLLNSSGFGSMGYSLPAAIGASYATNNDLTVAFMGDGGLQMNLQELNTLSLKKRNIKCFIFNNNTLGMMREVQARYYNSHFIGSKTSEFTCPNIKMLAKTFNLKFMEIKEKKQISKLDKVFKDDEPYLIDVKIQLNSNLLNRYDEAKIFESETIND